MALGVNQMTITTGAVFVPELWSNRTLDAVEANLVMANLVDRYDDEFSQYGDIVRIPNVSDLSVNTKSANAQVTLNAVTEVDTTLTVDQHKECSFVIEDILKIQSKYNLRDKYTNKAGYAIGKNVDAALHGLYAGLSQNVGGDNLFTKGLLLQAIQKLDDADAPEINRYLVIKPVSKANMLNLDDFTRYDALGEAGRGNPIRTGKLGDYFGIEVYISTQTIQVAGTPPVVHNLLFQKEAFGLAMQQSPRVQAQYVLEYLGTLVVTNVLYGFGEIRDTFAVDVRTNATSPAI